MIDYCGPRAPVRPVLSRAVRARARRLALAGGRRARRAVG